MGRQLWLISCKLANSTEWLKSFEVDFVNARPSVNYESLAEAEAVALIDF